jgi:succinate dehydrogenase/fumarate reductase flavoprotein subunit
MAGLVAAARARELGLQPVVYEKGSPPGGSMLLSSCVVWRYRSLEVFREECPGGDPALQSLIVDRLDGALAWLEALGAPVVARETGNPRTTGLRFDPGGLVDALARAGGELRLDEPLGERQEGVPTVLATGGFQGDRELVRRWITPEADALLLRANPWSTGDGLRIGLAAGAAISAGLGEFYGRNMPAPPAHVGPDAFVSLAQLYARHARVESETGECYPAERVGWSETDVVQWTATRPGARAWYVVDPRSMSVAVRGRPVADMVAAAREAGGTVEQRGEDVAVRVAPGITTTLGGLAIDGRARVLRGDGIPLDGLYAVGADAGGISVGGYSSGLAAALVLGLAAIETIAETE